MGLCDEIEDAFKGEFISGKEFEKGLTLKVEGKPHYIKASEAKYGFDEGHPHAGMTIRWPFTEADQVRNFDTKGKNFKTAMDESEAKVGDTVKIIREGEGMQTVFVITKLSAEEIEALDKEAEALAQSMGGEVIDPPIK